MQDQEEFYLEAAVWTASWSLRVSLLADVHGSVAALDQCAGRATNSVALRTITC